MILRGIFYVVSHFPLHFMLYRGNLDCFSNCGSSLPGPHLLWGEAAPQGPRGGGASTRRGEEQNKSYTATGILEKILADFVVLM